jgi:hypothetical protein
MKIIVDRDIHKDEMQIAIRLPMALLNFDKEARDRLDYLMLRVATAPVDSSADKLIEALLHLVTSFKQKAELDKAELQKLYANQMMQQSAQSGFLSAKGLQNMLGVYGSGGVVPPSNPPPKPDAFNRMAKFLKDKTT